MIFCDHCQKTLEEVHVKMGYVMAEVYNPAEKEYWIDNKSISPATITTICPICRREIAKDEHYLEGIIGVLEGGIVKVGGEHVEI